MPPVGAVPAGAVSAGAPAAGIDPDAVSVAALRAGDETAFADLVRRHHRAMLRVAAASVADLALAEDVVQDAWLAVLRGIDGFEGRSSFRTWLLRIVSNQARSRGERERRLVPLSAVLDVEATSPGQPAVDPSRFRGPDDPRWPGHWSSAPADWGDAEGRLLRRETREAIAAAIEGLGAAQRLVITLRDVAGWDADEVCSALEISPGNQRVLLHRARSRVRAALERYLAVDPHV